MIKPFELFQSIMALGIIIFSVISTYYGTRVLFSHYKIHGKLLSCCWLTLIQILSQLSFFVIFFLILEDLIAKDSIISFDPSNFAILFIRPVIFINNVVVAIYLKIRYKDTKNLLKIENLKEEIKHG